MLHGHFDAVFGGTGVAGVAGYRGDAEFFDHVGDFDPLDEALVSGEDTRVGGGFEVFYALGYVTCEWKHVRAPQAPSDTLSQNISFLIFQNQKMNGEHKL